MSGLAHELVNTPAFAVTWLTFFGAAAVTFAIQMYMVRQTVSPLAFIRHAFPFELWKTKSAHMDLKVYALRKVVDKLFGGVGLICTLATSSQLSRLLTLMVPRHHTLHPTYLAILACSICVFVAGEFADYVQHYVQHRIPILWELHKTHHSALFLNPFTASRGHPIAFVVERAWAGVLIGLPVGVSAFLFQMNLAEMFFLTACASKLFTVVTMDPLKHSHFPIGLGWMEYGLISPHMHQVHHSSLKHHWDKNFGTNLSIFDWMFGTAYKPTKGEPIVYGTGKEEDKDYDKLTGFYVGPLVKMWRLAGQGRVAFTPSSAQNDAAPAPQDRAA